MPPKQSVQQHQDELSKRKKRYHELQCAALVAVDPQDGEAVVGPKVAAMLELAAEYMASFSTIGGQRKAALEEGKEEEAAMQEKYDEEIPETASTFTRVELLIDAISLAHKVKEPSAAFVAQTSHLWEALGRHMEKNEVQVRTSADGEPEVLTRQGCFLQSIAIDSTRLSGWKALGESMHSNAVIQIGGTSYRRQECLQGGPLTAGATKSAVEREKSFSA